MPLSRLYFQTFICECSGTHECYAVSTTIRRSTVSNARCTRNDLYRDYGIGPHASCGKFAKLHLQNNWGGGGIGCELRAWRHSQRQNYRSLIQYVGRAHSSIIFMQKSRQQKRFPLRGRRRPENSSIRFLFLRSERFSFSRDETESMRIDERATLVTLESR